MGVKVGLVLAALALLVAAPSHGRQSAPRLQVPMEVSIPHAPALAKAGGLRYLVYEIHLTNFWTRPQTITALEVFSGDTGDVVATRDGPALRASARYLSDAPGDQAVMALSPGQRAIVSLWLPLGDRAPASLRHRLEVLLDGRDATLPIESAPVSVHLADPLVITPPLRGGPWLAGNGPAPEKTPAHNQLLYPRDGEIVMPQRYATDWVKLGEDGGLFERDITSNANWWTYSEEVLAVGDGTVIEVREGVEENTPPEVTTPMTAQTVAGNLIVLDLGQGRYAVYGHLAPGSVTVRPGTKVQAGQVIAKVGNSGNSTGPHLHFHIIDSPSGAAGQGVPFVFTAYRLMGPLNMPLEALEEGDRWTRPETSEPRTEDLPLNGSVVLF